MPGILSVLVCAFVFIVTIFSGVIMSFVGMALFFVMLKSGQLGPNEVKVLLTLFALIVTDALVALLSYIGLRHLGFFPKKSPV